MRGDWREWLEKADHDLRLGILVAVRSGDKQQLALWAQQRGRTLLHGMRLLAEAVEAVERDKPMFCPVCDAQLVSGHPHYESCQLGVALDFLRGVGRE